MERARRVGVGLLAALILTTGTQIVGLPEAEARKVGNPGSGFALRVQSGFLRIKTRSFSFNDEGRQPQCSDGQNNGDGDQDSAVDFPADAQCSSATDDSETAPGFQPKQPIQMNNGTVTAAGAVTFPASGVSFPPQYLYVNADEASGGAINDFIVTITISPLANFTGSINPLTGAMDLRMQVRVDADGGPLASNCRIEPIDINALITGTTSPPGPNTPISGVPYNPSTGRATIVNNSFSVPGAQGCGTVALFVDLNDQINNQLGLPSPAGNNEAQFLVEFTPTRVTPGVTASFTTTPSSGPAPLTVSFNAGASTGTGLSYQWDFTNNGSFDATGVTTSFTYGSPGAFTARLRVTDSDTDFVETTRLISVGANLPPTANDQTVSTAEDTPRSVTLTASDPEGGALTFALAAPAAAHGSVTGTPPNVTYAPAANYNGPDQFGFTVTDNFGNVDAGLVTVNVTPVNDGPTATDVSASTTEDTATSVLLAATDVDGDTLTYTIVVPPTRGGLSGTPPSLTYTPNANENGTDTFTYRATDPSNAQSNVATATITISAVNDAPVADDQSVTTPEDTAVAITLTASDPDPGPLTFSLVTLPAHGTLAGSFPNLTYTPAGNYNGPDSFVFRAADASGASDTATVDITVQPGNDAPTTTDVSVSTVEDTPVTVTIVADDIDGDALSYTPTSPTASGGTVSCSGNECTYTPASGFSGTDSFTVLVDDSNGGTATSMVTVDVSAFDNAPPVMGDTTHIVIEDTPRTFALAASDADGDPLNYTVVVPPAEGSLGCSPAGACTYSPAPNAVAPQTFIVRASDGRGGVDEATITLFIVPSNDPPTVSPASIVTEEDTAATVDLVASDPDGDSLTWVVKRAPFHGSVTCTAAGHCTYSPAADFNGTDSFEVEVDDGHGGRVRTTVPVTVNAVNDPPTAGTVPVTLLEDGSAAFSLVGGDADGPVTFSAGSATLGTLGCDAAGACTFTAAANANRTDTVAYSVDDGSAVATGTIVITIVPVNDEPTAADMALGTAEDTPISFTLAGSDVDAGDVLTFSLTSAPAVGTLSGVAPNLTYTPAPEASGTVAFGYRVTDAAGATDTAAVTITVMAVDDAPVANNVAVATPEDTATAIALTGSDAEGPVTVAITSPPIHGTYAGGVYTPAPHYFGPDALGFRVTDGGGQTADGTATIEVTPVNDAPVAFDAAYTTTRTVAIPITLNASDADGDALTYAILTGPGHGSLTGSGANYTYTPTGLYTGPDVFTFKVTDAAGAIASATVNITVAQGMLATQLTVHPATVTKPFLIGNYRYNNLSATLRTAGGIPIPGQWIVFAVNNRVICGASTDANGLAVCSGQGPRQNAATYTAVFGGSPGYAPSGGSGVLS